VNFTLAAYFSLDSPHFKYPKSTCGYHIVLFWKLEITISCSQGCLGIPRDNLSKNIFKKYNEYARLNNAPPPRYPYPNPLNL
jgi:hypothetical protein